jgi:hypothetical protein
MGVFQTRIWLVAVSTCLSLVVGCGGGASSVSAPGPSSNPSPTLTAITPTTAVAGSTTLMLTATGTGFVSGSEVEWNGATLSTTVLSSTQLQAAVPSADLAGAGSQNVTVTSPAPGGGISAVVTFTVNAAQNPVPAINALSPPQAVVGSPGFTLTVTGTGFVAGSQILWNGSARSTAFLSSTSLSTQASSSDVATAATVNVAVSNPPPGGGSSNAVNFSIETVTSNFTVLNVEGNDLAWVPQQQRLYVSVPAAASAMGNTIAVVDPIAGKVVTSATATSEAGRLSPTDDGQFLYAILSSENSVARYTLPAVAPDIKWNMGSDPIFFGTLTPVDMRAQPGAAHTVAVIRDAVQSPGNDIAVVIYDDAVARPTTSQSAYILNSLAWSDTAFYTFPVNSGGAGAATQYGAAFRQWGVHLHSDPQTGYVYTDRGEVVNGADGLPVGNYPVGPAAGYPTALTAVDPALGRVFVLTSTMDATGAPAFLVRAYDQKEFRLLESLLIPGAVGVPVEFVRWGQSGLTFVTNGAAMGMPSVGKLYILDGAFVNPAGPLDGSSGTPINPLPTLVALSPVSAAAGSGGVTLTLTGRDFLGQPTVQWNGAEISSTWVSNTELQATVPASELASAGLATVMVANGGPGGGTSTPLPFSILAAPSTGNAITVYGVGGNDVVWDSLRQKFYVSTPGIQGEFGDKIVVVDPVAGTITPSVFIGSDPAELSLSSDAQYLYVGLNGHNSVQRLTLPALIQDISFPLGSDSFDGPFFALGLKGAPGSPHAAAVSTAIFSGSPSSTGITIFDDATPRPTRAPGWNTSGNAYAAIEWGSDASTMYAPAQFQATDLYVLGVNGNGIQISKDYPGALQFATADYDLHFDKGTGLLYTDGGQVVRPSDAAILGTFAASGMLVPDSVLNRVFILGQTTAQAGTTNFTIESFDQTSFAPVGSITIANVVGTPGGFVRWGTSGLAFVTRVGGITDTFNIGPGQLYVISGAFVSSAAPAGSAARSSVVGHVRKTWNSRGSSANRKAQRSTLSLP